METTLHRVDSQVFDIPEIWIPPCGQILVLSLIFLLDVTNSSEKKKVSYIIEFFWGLHVLNSMSIMFFLKSDMSYSQRYILYVFVRTNIKHIIVDLSIIC